MSFISNLLLQAATTPAAAPVADSAAKGGGNGMFMNILFIGGMIAVFYFFMIRPQKKKQNEQAKFIEEIKKGEKIATIGGIVGKVLETRTKTFVIETEGGGRLQLLRSAISWENTKALNAEDEKKDESKDDKKA